jgi:hypothetical protein
MIFGKEKTYEDGLEEFKNMGLNNVHPMPNDKGFVGFLPNGNAVNIRKSSKGNHQGTEKWPTLGIADSKGRPVIKIRYTSGK